MAATLAQPFLSTPSARRATRQIEANVSNWEDFYPRPPRGGRPKLAAAEAEETNFYPRPPRGGRPEARADEIYTSRISIHALREEGDWSLVCSMLLSNPISIHALREEGDKEDTTVEGWLDDFYPRPPRGGRLNVSAAKPTRS